MLTTAIGAIDKGTAAGMTSTGFSLTPVYMVQSDSLTLLPRSVVGSAIDIGAYEYEVNVGISLLTTTNQQTTTNIYPNPFNQSAKIRFQSSVKGVVTVKIYDNSGKCVKTISAFSANGCISINRDRLMTGFYYYEIIGNNDEIIGRGKMIVM